ncbi:hypothetical protein UFOVP60_24 [uncultured Caudovirales phage]|uniref:Uncharacterized protein n=1 Tax=uncultured Caudovirales phage TaxID=2100421 RepID=A0A6J5TAX0_9CAUD|nr:hypothetical protein UFOVP60_24 [uncultured Caudovirales phage]
MSTTPPLHIPAHKQVAPAKKPAQVVFIDGEAVIVSPAHNVWVQAVKQDKEQAK